jgi:hypothetical protein
MKPKLGSIFIGTILEHTRQEQLVLRGKMDGDNLSVGFAKLENISQS